MNALIVLTLACVAVVANSVPIGVVHALDDGQWHGEGLLESQDWASPHASAIVAHRGLVHDGLLHNGLVHHGLVHDGLVHHGALHHGLHGLGHAAIVAGPSGAIVHNVAPGHLGLGHHGHWW